MYLCPQANSLLESCSFLLFIQYQPSTQWMVSDAWLNSSTYSTCLSISKCLSEHWTVNIVTIYFKTWGCLQLWLCVANVLSAHQHKPFHHVSSTVMMCHHIVWHQPTCSKYLSALTFGRDAKTLHCPVFALQLLTHHQVLKDITHLYHLDLFHVPCGSLPCVNQNCEGAT